MKKIIVGVFVLLLLCGIGGYFIFSNLNFIVKAGIEKYGSEATQTNVTLGQVDLSLLGGVGALKELSISNPEGFKTDKAFYLGNISLEIDKKSMAGNGPIVINKIAITSPSITYEIAASGNSNLKTIQRNTESYATDSSKAKTETSKKTGDPANRKIIIKSFTMTNAEIAISHDLLRGKTVLAKLPTVQLNNIGQEKDGATPAEVASVILATISASAAEVAGVALTNRLSLKDVSSEAVEKVGVKLLGIIRK